MHWLSSHTKKWRIINCCASNYWVFITNGVVISVCYALIKYEIRNNGYSSEKVWSRSALVRYRRDFFEEQLFRELLWFMDRERKNGEGFREPLQKSQQTKQIYFVHISPASTQWKKNWAAWHGHKKHVPWRMTWTSTWRKIHSFCYVK